MSSCSISKCRSLAVPNWSAIFARSRPSPGLPSTPSPPTPVNNIALSSWLLVLPATSPNRTHRRRCKLLSWVGLHRILRLSLRPHALIPPPFYSSPACFNPPAILWNPLFPGSFPKSASGPTPLRARHRTCRQSSIPSSDPVPSSAPPLSRRTCENSLRQVRGTIGTATYSNSVLYWKSPKRASTKYSRALLPADSATRPTSHTSNMENPSRLR